MADAQIYADLKKDHDRHRALLEKISDTSRGSDERGALFEELRKELQAHAAAEEESLYSLMLANPDLRDEARHSVSEHKEIDDFLGELVEMSPDDSGWIAKFREMRERYEHHIDEEEEEMFPSASKELPKSDEDKAAKVFEERKPKELERAESEQPGDARD
ncbi:MAG TPA: hemerythrin domain-containing protein [Allosphingosinicella sp.]